MIEIDKKSLSEQDICTKFITPAIEKAGWDKMRQFLQEVYFTDGRIYLNGKMTKRGTGKRADYILYYKPNIPLAIIEAKDNKHSLGDGMQQALEYAKILDIPFVFSSNGDGFLFHDKTITNPNQGNIENELSIDEFPSPSELWNKYKIFKGITSEDEEKIVEQDYYLDSTGRLPRYYQQIAVNRTLEAIAKGQDRVLLVMATGTGKTYTAFQIIHRLWKSGAKKRILFLADRNALIDQTRRGDFKHFKDKMTVIKNRTIDKSYEIYLALYQGLSGSDDDANAYKQFSPEFFDLIIIDECHRGSAKEDSSWREILTYFNKATHVGLTATPKETNEISNSEYFGEPVYTYSLKQGISDGFLAPYCVLRINLNVDVDGWRPDKGKKDKKGKLVKDRVYNRMDYDRNMVIDERTKVVAEKVTEFLKSYDRYAKTIIFCVDIDHAERMRSVLSNLNSDMVAENDKYIMRITGDNEEGKRELDNFINPEEKFPVIATTSELMTTGIDAQTCKVIVLDAEIKSMTKFKQIVGRGTRINEHYNKMYFTILDFRNVTDLFADEQFDGNPVAVKVLKQDDEIVNDEEGQDIPIYDDDSGEQIEFKPTIRKPLIKTFILENREKVYVNGVEVSPLATRMVYFDDEGKQITTSLQDHTKNLVKGKYPSLDLFLTRWNSEEKKKVIIDELEEQGIFVEDLRKAVNNEVDLFDLICHIAFDRPPLTRKERANNVKKRDYFSKYGEDVKKVLEALLDKYADEGLLNLESVDILSVQPLPNYGTPVQIIKKFGSKAAYLTAIKELQEQLYKIVA